MIFNATIQLKSSYCREKIELRNVYKYLVKLNNDNAKIISKKTITHFVPALCFRNNVIIAYSCHLSTSNTIFFYNIFRWKHYRPYPPKIPYLKNKKKHIVPLFSYYFRREWALLLLILLHSYPILKYMIIYYIL